MAVRSQAGADELVVVRLSQVPEKKRVEVANRIIRVEGLVGVAMLNMTLAALQPVQDPEVEVTAADARRKGVRL